MTPLGSVNGTTSREFEELEEVACSGGKLNILSNTGEASDRMALRTRKCTLSEDWRMTSACGLLNGEGASFGVGGGSVMGGSVIISGGEVSTVVALLVPIRSSATCHI